MGFEDRMVANIDRKRKNREEMPRFMIDAHKRAKSEILNNREYAIQSTDFVDLYGEKNVELDMLKVLQLEKKFAKNDKSSFEKNSKMTAEVFEAIVLMHSELSEWLGNAHTLKTSRYDDYINKTDLIAEWQHEGGTRHLALAVDVTFGKVAIEKKMTQIKEEIERDELGEVKYHRSDFDDSRGERKNVPRVVIGISKENVEQLAQLWMQNDNKSLGIHPVQRVILAEIQMQLETMKEYAERNGKERAVRAYERALNIVEGLHEQKENIPFGDLRDDPVFSEIQHTTERLFEE